MSQDGEEFAIEQNLQTITNKRRLAQEIYYRNAGQSPLTRGTANQQENKQPVHQRLGTTKKVLRRRIPHIPINSNGMMPITRNRIRLRRTNANGVSPVTALNTFRQNPSAQQRLYRIRQQHFENASQVTQFRTKLLRRRRPDMLPSSQPTNFTVEVDNTDFRKHYGPAKTHSVHGSVNQRIQSEIQLIQNQSSFSHEIITSAPIHVPDHGFTTMSINDRFSRLP